MEPICTECLALEEAARRSVECKKCESPYECVCDLLIEYGNCPMCMKLVYATLSGTGPLIILDCGLAINDDFYVGSYVYDVNDDV